MIDLVVDDGIVKRSHWNAIFAAHMVYIGVGIAAHDIEEWVIVIDYSA